MARSKVQMQAICPFDKRIMSPTVCCRASLFDKNQAPGSDTVLREELGSIVPAPERYEKPALTVDVVVTASMDGQHKVLLIQRKSPPFEGCWAIPGGFVNPHEPLEDAAHRELFEETGTEPAHLEQLHTFGAPGRDPRGWTISVAYLAVLEEHVAQAFQPHAGDDAAEVGWFDLLAPPPLAFDHADILAHARKALAIKQLPAPSASARSACAAPTC